MAVFPVTPDALTRLAGLTPRTIAQRELAQAECSIARCIDSLTRPWAFYGDAWWMNVMAAALIRAEAAADVARAKLEAMS